MFVTTVINVTRDKPNGKFNNIKRKISLKYIRPDKSAIIAKQYFTSSHIMLVIIWQLLLKYIMKLKFWNACEDYNIH